MCWSTSANVGFYTRCKSSTCGFHGVLGLISHVQCAMSDYWSFCNKIRLNRTKNLAAVLTLTSLQIVQFLLITGKSVIKFDLCTRLLNRFHNSGAWINFNTNLAIFTVDYSFCNQVQLIPNQLPPACTRSASQQPSRYIQNLNPIP